MYCRLLLKLILRDRAVWICTLVLAAAFSVPIAFNSPIYGPFFMKQGMQSFVDSTFRSTYVPQRIVRLKVTDRMKIRATGARRMAERYRYAGLTVFTFSAMPYLRNVVIA